MKSRIAAVIAPMLLSMLVLVVPAHATFPGGNGKIVFASDRNVPASVHCDPRAVEGLFCADIWTMNADGSGQALLQSDGVEEAWPPFPTWSADGQRIAFVHDYRVVNHETDIFVMDASGGNLQQVSSHFNGVGDLAWSPDGGRIAYAGGGIGTIAFPPDGNPSVVVAGNDGEHEYFRPDWSPDGRLIAFLRTTAFGDFDYVDNIYVADPNGGNLRALTSGGGGGFQADYDPSFSPDGQTVLFVRSLPRGNPPVGRRADLYTVPVGGGTPTRITDTPTFDESLPVWSPDGTKIAFMGKEQGDVSARFHIFTINADGTGRQQLTSGSFNDAQPDWQPLPGPQRGDYKNAAQFCKAERSFLGVSDFRKKYAKNHNGANAFGKCASQNQ